VSHVPHLRLATARDAPAIAAMSRDLIEAGLGWSWTPSRVRGALASRDTNVVVARTPGRVIGFGIMRYRMWTAHLDLLAVAPDHRRRGLGRRLVEWLEAVAEVAGVVSVYVEARASRAETLAFYGRLGYAEVERLLRYYGGREDAIRLAKALRVPVEAAAPWPVPLPGPSAAHRRD
jgi:ribosomal-protein-alanine N-acetyltransferase